MAAPSPSIRPAMAWGLSFVLLVCVSAGGFLWHVSNDRQQAGDRIVSESGVVGSAIDDTDVDAAVTAWGRTNLFEDLASIEGAQAEQVRQRLKSAQNGKLNLQ